ncbi:O-antigen ligase family protein [Desulfurobacterium indicum]|uniref:O-antigen ligase-related domain-containing protein n=1 Tax=Desulfurobacterium indicum TaxID=1914305 RepID=A0A1R1MLU0_9BACT|nr:O-antigen ligase family protein [Desulfurobacterium indicum]OMH40723.1 hypothetical protein BLW93_03875 [Desulfurobacterium indicum]
MKLTFPKIGSVLLSLSVYLLTLTIPVSIAGDNIAIGIGVLGVILLFLSNERMDFPNLKPLAFFLVPEGISVLFAKNVKKAWKQTSLNHHLLPLIFVYDRLKKGLSLERILKFLSFSSIVLSSSVIVEAFTHQNVKHFKFSRFHLFFEPVRGKGILNHQLTTAGVLYLLFLLFAGFFIRQNQDRQSKKIYGITTCFLFLAILLNQSRSYWIGMFVAFLLFFVLLYRKRAVFYISGFLAFFLGFTLVFAPLRARLESIVNTKTNGSNTTRLIIWRSHYEAIKNDFSLKEKLFGSPVAGKDMCCKYIPESYEKVLGKKPPKIENLCDKQFYHCLSHNIYIKYLTDFGLLGLLGYVTFILYLILVNIRGFSLSGDSIFATFASMYTGFATAGFFENNFTDAEVKICFIFILGINFYLLDKLRSGERV